MPSFLGREQKLIRYLEKMSRTCSRARSESFEFHWNGFPRNDIKLSQVQYIAYTGQFRNVPQQTMFSNPHSFLRGRR